MVSSVHTISTPPATRAPRPSRSAAARKALLPRPKSGEVRVRVHALGLSALGLQAAGLVEAVGPDAGGFAPGDRVSWRSTADAQGLLPVLPERDLIGFPKDISLEKAASLLPHGLIARTVVKQLHAIGRGNRVFVAPDQAGADGFVRAWVADAGGVIVSTPDDAEVVIAASDYEVARRWRYGKGLSQQAAVDVFQAVRRGVFDTLEISMFPLDRAEEARLRLASTPSVGPMLLVPTAAAA